MSKFQTPTCEGWTITIDNMFMRTDDELYKESITKYQPHW